MDGVQIAASRQLGYVVEHNWRSTKDQQQLPSPATDDFVGIRFNDGLL